MRVNIIPKEGGNRFSGSGFANFPNDRMQGRNVDDTLRSQGVLTADSVLTESAGPAGHRQLEHHAGRRRGQRFARPSPLGRRQYVAHRAGDIFNVFNSNAAVGATSNAGEPPAAINTTYGSAWLKPLNILQARDFKLGAQFTF